MLGDNIPPSTYNLFTDHELLLSILPNPKEASHRMTGLKLDPQILINAPLINSFDSVRTVK